MSYLTLELDHGRVSPKGVEGLPRKASEAADHPESASTDAARPYGLAKGQFTVLDDVNAPLPEDLLQASG